MQGFTSWNPKHISHFSLGITIFSIYLNAEVLVKYLNRSKRQNKVITREMSPAATIAATTVETCLRKWLMKKKTSLRWSLLVMIPKNVAIFLSSKVERRQSVPKHVSLLPLVPLFQNLPSAEGIDWGGGIFTKLKTKCVWRSDESVVGQWSKTWNVLERSRVRECGGQF